MIPAMVRAGVLGALGLACCGSAGLATERKAPSPSTSAEKCPKPEPTVVEIKVFGPAASAVLLHGPEAEQWYPPYALDHGKFGGATLDCRIVDGKADACTVDKEDGHWGFGAISLRLAKRFDPPPGPDGEHVKLHYQLIILAIGYRQVHVTDVFRRPCPEPTGHYPLSDAALD